jgi:hypothetical protein
MALSKERIGEIAMLVLQHKVERDGNIRLNPAEIKREFSKSSKELGITPQECAEFVGILLKTAYDKCMAEIAKVAKRTRSKSKTLHKGIIPVCQ